MRIAVVGTGISGLGAAWLLDQEHEVTLYEKADRVGGHSNTVGVSSSRGDQGVDTGFIVYNERNYPCLKALFDYLGVATQPTDMSFSASVDQGRMEYAGDNLDTLFGQRTNLLRWRHWRMLGQILRFNRHARQMLDHPELEECSLGAFLRDGGYSQELRDHYLLPMGAAIWSCPPVRMLDFPAASFLRFFHNHGLLTVNDRPQWRTVTGGSREYVKRLLDDLRGQVHTGCGVACIERDEHGVTLIDAHGGRHRHDHVVIAAHADQALSMLDAPGFWERTLLGAFRYQHNRAVLHTDTALMPRRRKVWASWNYLSYSGRDAGESKVAVTYWMNRLQRLQDSRPLLVTLNPGQEPSPDKVLAEFDYEHPVFDARAIRSQGLLAHLQGQRRTWFCGSYFGYGFHEDGLRSGIEVARRFGVQPPWESSCPARNAPPVQLTRGGELASPASVMV